MARPRSDIKQRLCRAARDRFLADGVDGASLREIARDAKTNIGMIYYYYPTKDDLFLAVVEEVYEGVLADIVKALAPGAPVETRLERLFARFDALSDDEVVVFRIVMREALAGTPRLDPIIQRFQRGHLPLVVALVAEGIGDRTFTSRVPPPLVFFSIIAMGVFPQIARRIVANRPGLPLALLEAGPIAPKMVDLLLRGISNPKESGGAGAPP